MILGLLKEYDHFILSQYQPGWPGLASVSTGSGISKHLVCAESQTSGEKKQAATTRASSLSLWWDGASHQQDSRGLCRGKWTIWKETWDFSFFFFFVNSVFLTAFVPDHFNTLLNYTLISAFILQMWKNWEEQVIFCIYLT